MLKAKLFYYQIVTMLNETQLNGILLDQNNSVFRMFVVTQTHGICSQGN